MQSKYPKKEKEKVKEDTKVDKNEVELKISAPFDITNFDNACTGFILFVQNVYNAKSKNATPLNVEKQVWWGKSSNQQLFNLGLPIGYTLIFTLPEGDKKNHTKKLIVGLRSDFDENKQNHVNIMIYENTIKELSGVPDLQLASRPYIKTLPNSKNNLMPMSFIASKTPMFKSKNVIIDQFIALAQLKNTKYTLKIVENNKTLNLDFFGMVRLCLKAAIDYSEAKEKEKAPPIGKDLDGTLGSYLARLNDTEILEKYLDLIIQFKVLSKDLLFALCGINDKLEDTVAGLVHGRIDKDKITLDENNSTNRTLFDNHLDFFSKKDSFEGNEVMDTPENSVGYRLYKKWIVDPLLVAAGYKLSLRIPQLEHYSPEKTIAVDGTLGTPKQELKEQGPEEQSVKLTL